MPKNKNARLEELERNFLIHLHDTHPLLYAQFKLDLEFKELANGKLEMIIAMGEYYDPEEKEQLMKVWGKWKHAINKK